MSSKTLVLVDGSSYLFRAFHALPPLTSSSGEPTGAVHGVLNMLNKLLREHDTQHVAVVFDASGKTFRDDLFADYKANRPPMPDDLRAQIDPILTAVEGMGLPLLRIGGVEADDVIGTLCRRAIDDGMRVLVSTSDKDMAQLVEDGITLVNTMSDTTLDRDGVKAKFGVYPEQMIDYLALVGDTSDNIPGVPKVGPKTAAKWLNEYDTVDAIIEHAEDIKGKVGESLRDNIDDLLLSRELATICKDVELPKGPADLKRSEPDTGALRELYERLELRALLRQLGEEPAPEPTAAEAPPPAVIENVEYETILSDKELKRWLKALAKAPLIAIDTETTSLDYIQAELVGLSFAIEPGKAAYVPVGHDYPGAPDQLDRDAVLAAMKPILEDRNRPKVGHHLKYDAHVFARYGIRLEGVRFDTMLESYVLNSVATRHDMDSTSKHYLGVDTVHYEDVAGKGAKQLTFNQVGIDEAAPYAAEDADITLRLHDRLWSELGKVPSLKSVYETIEQPLAPVLFAMEEAGVLLDRDMLKTQSRELADAMRDLEEEAYELAGGPFNLGSPKQLQEILFDRQGLPVLRKTPKGQPSTAEDVLQELADNYDLPRVILDYRGLAKLKSTYTDKLPLQVASATGRVHTSYHQAVAATGRLSSADPNLQNIPIRTPEGRRIRQAFVAPEGKVMVAADYSQIELRIMAHLSGDDGLLRAFKEGRDIHQATAAEVFEVPLDDVTANQRRSAKAINFGLMYGMSAFGLAKQLGVHRAMRHRSTSTSTSIAIPGVKSFHGRHRGSRPTTSGFVETVFGRRLISPGYQQPQRTTGGNTRNAARSTPRCRGPQRTSSNVP